MRTRRDFLKTTGALAAGSFILPGCGFASGESKITNVGIELYSVRDDMMKDAVGSLEKLAKIGYKQLESAQSTKGSYYGLAPKEIKKISSDLGMTVRSGHVHIDANWKKTLDEAAEVGQEYLICSSLPFTGQTVANYEKNADAFSKAGEDCKKLNITFGYHNHDYEFEKENGQVLYDTLLTKTDPALVIMEMDLGWVVMSGFEPVDYFNKYPGRFPLWHLKDMDRAAKRSTEFGKGAIDISKMFANAKKSGMKYFFVEQEEYTSTAFESVQEDYDYLMKMK